MRFADVGNLDYEYSVCIAPASLFVINKRWFTVYDINM